MADSLPMAQIPNPSPVSVSAPQYQNPGLAFGSGFSSGINAQQQQQALNIQKQQLAMQQQQQTISQVDTLLKSGMNYPGMLPTFWPAIATRMNSLSPDYQLDPNTPPDNLKNFATQLSSISDGLQDKAVSPPQAHAATLQLIQSSFPVRAPADVGQTAGTPSPSGSPVMQASQGQPSQGMPQGQPPQGQPQQQQQGQDPLSNFAAIKAQYDKANQLISQAPMEGPQSQEVLRKQLESSSLGLNYKKALDQLATTANQQYTEGQQNQRNQMNQDQDSIRSLATGFDKDTADNQNAFNNFNVFNTQMRLSNQFAGSKDTTAAVNTEKAALMAYAQMAFPGTGRPGNPEAMEEMAKSGSFGTLVQQRMNQLDKGEIMTESQVMGLRQSALGIAQAREQSHTDLENSASQGIQLHGGNPQAFLKNYRPSTLASTSKLYPNQNSQAAGTIKKLTINGKPGTYQLLTAGGGGDPKNWAPVEGNGN